MMRITIRTSDLKSTFREALQSTEGKMVLHADGNPLLASPCREGWYVQRLRGTAVEGGRCYALPPEVISRSCDILASLSKAVTLEITEDGLLLRAGKGLVCRFSAICERAEILELRDVFSARHMLLPGTAFKEALSKAAVPWTSGPDGIQECHLQVTTQGGVVEVSGSNGQLESCVSFRTTGNYATGSCLLPTQLISRSFAWHRLWSKDVRLHVGSTASLGNDRAVIVWKRQSLASDGEPSSRPTFEARWNERGSFSCWTQASAILNAVDLLNKETRRHAVAHVLNWDSEGLRLLPAFRKIDASAEGQSNPPQEAAAHWVQAWVTAPVAVSSVTCLEPGSLVVATDSLYTIHEAFKGKEQQLRLSKKAMVFGSPVSFIVNHGA